MNSNKQNQVLVKRKMSYITKCWEGLAKSALRHLKFLVQFISTCAICNVPETCSTLDKRVNSFFTCSIGFVLKRRVLQTRRIDPLKYCFGNSISSPKHLSGIHWIFHKVLKHQCVESPLKVTSQDFSSFLWASWKLVVQHSSLDFGFCIPQQQVVYRLLQAFPVFHLLHILYQIINQ